MLPSWFRRQKRMKALRCYRIPDVFMHSHRRDENRSKIGSSSLRRAATLVSQVIFAPAGETVSANNHS